MLDNPTTLMVIKPNFLNLSDFLYPCLSVSLSFFLLSCYLKIQCSLAVILFFDTVFCCFVYSRKDFRNIISFWFSTDQHFFLLFCCQNIFLFLMFFVYSVFILDTTYKLNHRGAIINKKHFWMKYTYLFGWEKLTEKSCIFHSRQETILFF